MTDIIEKIQNDFNEFMKQAKELIEKERVANATKTKRWKPNKLGENYYAIWSHGFIGCYTWGDGKSENSCFKLGNCFKTYEEAQKELERRVAEQELLDMCDWNNGMDLVWSIVYSFNDGFVIGCYSTIMTNCYRFASEESAKKAFNTLGEDKLKLVFRID